LIKRRTVAKELCDAGRVSINGRVAKAGSELAVGDTLVIRYGQKTVEVSILAVAETARKESAGELYKVLSESPREDVISD
jgi:ribosomal 50S subunit-recycling heat shock protein